MAGLNDLMARATAAGGMMGGAAGAPPPDAPMPPTGDEPLPGDETEGAPDIEAGASMIEAFAETLDPATGDQIRDLLNQIRELAASSVPAEEAAMPEEGGAEALAAPEGGEPSMDEGMPPL